MYKILYLFNTVKRIINKNSRPYIDLKYNSLYGKSKLSIENKRDKLMKEFIEIHNRKYTK